MKLRRNEYCPIRRSLSCRGREPVRRERSLIRTGVQRVDDPHPENIQATHWWCNEEKGQLGWMTDERLARSSYSEPKRIYAA